MYTETYELRGQVFQWDRDKHLANIKKHGISFKTAAKAFFDPNADEYEDATHSNDEERFILIGMDESERILTVCHCLRGKNDSVVRIISARKATRNEEEMYGGAF